MNAPLSFHRWTMQLDGPETLQPKYLQREDIAVRRVEIPWRQINQFLFAAVGTEYRWGGRDDWTDDDWTAFTDRDELETWVLYVRGTPAGYFETEHFQDGSARIHTFGLMRPFIGQGLGAHLLSFAAQRAFDRGATRIWLRTCTKDHPHALRNYQARGFHVIHEEDVFL